LVEALAGKKVIGAAAGDHHTAVWTDAGEFFTFGDGRSGRLGHEDADHELVPRLVEALAGKMVIGASAVNTTHRQVVVTHQCGLKQGRSSPLGLNTAGSWARRVTL
jgi:alpha-tubulin suppressor-like RCC1 family protein